MFDPTLVREAEAVFAELLSLPAPERERRLQTQCGGNAPLADLVRQLLTIDDSGMGSFLAGPAGCEGRVEAAGQVLPENTQIGNFRLLRRIGEGGMGIVYEARQCHPERNVALKIIRGGRFVDRYAIKLFHREVQALARLRHPCIGAIYEAGGTDDEEHFFAMELVEGRPLLEHVRETRVPPRERLALVCRICDAIHYAHQRGVMHRDLKPSNILIDAEGNPRILDFGLARITDTELGIDASRTAQGRIQGTLAYMSPEQARGDSAAIDIRSDVYSLGVILYELLADRLPYDVMELPLPRAVDTICNQPPRRTEALRGDLETITLRALEKDPQRRYASASALGEDIQRFLTSQPIEARRDSAWYVLRKALLRHRVAAAVSVAFVMLVSVSAIALGVMYRRQSQARNAEFAERERAEMETRKAVEEQVKTEQFAKFMEEIFNGVEPSVALGRDTRMLKGMMDAAAKRIEDGELHGVQAAELRLRNSIGGVYLAIAEFDAAERMLGSVVERAQRIHGPDTLEHAVALDHHARWLDSVGRPADALAEYEAALMIRRRLLPSDHEALGASLLRAGSMLKKLGRVEESLRHLEEARAMYQRLFPGDHLATARVLTGIAQNFEASGMPDKALPVAEDALAMLRRLFPGDHPSVAASLNSVASIRSSMGQHAEGLSRMEESLDMTRRLFAGDHPEVAVALTDIGAFLINLGRPADALPRVQEALSMHRRLFPGDHANVAASLNLVASTLQYLGRAEEAQPVAEESLAIRRRLYSTDHPEIAVSLSQVGSGFKMMGRPELALGKHEEALSMYQRLFPGDHPLVAQTVCHVANDLQSMGRFVEALPKIREGLAMYQRIHRGDHPEVANCYNNLATTYHRAGRLSEGLDACEAGLAMGRRILTPYHPVLCYLEIRKGSILVDLHRLPEAEDTLQPIWTNIADRAEVRAKNKEHCLEALVKLYEERAVNEPGKGYDARAHEYRLMLDRLRS
jgi:tetratricopeptide (TPR) repeat protein